MEMERIEKQVAVQKLLKATLRKAGFAITAELRAEACMGKVESDLCITAPDGEQYHVVILNRRQ